MTDLRIVRAVSSVTRGTADDQWMAVRGTRDGAPFTAEWFEGLAQEGRIFCATGGTVTTAVTWDATATIDVTKPVLWVSVPSGTVVIPLSIVLYMEAFGSNAQFECNAQLGTGGSRTSGGTAVTPTNLRSDAPFTSLATIYRGDGSPVFVGSTTNVSEFWRDGQQFAITKTTASATVSVSDPNRFVWYRRIGYGGPVCVGASQLAIHQGSQAGTGFVTLVYAEVPSTAIV